MEGKNWLLVLLLSASLNLFAETPTWADSVDTYARDVFMTANKYHWSWQSAALLRAMTAQYEWAADEEKKKYLDYITKAMNKVKGVANSRSPNSVASGLGMAFLARITGEEKYKRISGKIYEQYLKINRAENGGVSHKALYRELWDDTIFMVGVFLQEMYRLTGDEKYMNELVLQVEAHREKLRDEKWGLWYHGWDGDNKGRCNFCGQTGWSKNPEKRSEEIWGRGNGWVVVTLAQTIEILPQNNPNRTKLASYLKEMLEHLPELQDSVTGHWYQLPVRKGETGNYIESSCTAMFAFGISSALKTGIIEGDKYRYAIDLAYTGLRNYSMQNVNGPYLTTKNVCKGTCIGDKEYYFNRKATSEKPFGLAMFLLFGRSYSNN